MDPALQAALQDNGLTEEEFRELPERDQQNLLLDTKAVDGDTPGPDAATVKTTEWKAAPAPSPAPTPAPTAAPAPTGAPAASPAPTAAPAAPAADKGQVDADVEMAAPRPLSGADDAAKLTTLKGEKATLFDDFADGKLTRAEYNEKVGPIESQLEDISANIAADRAAGAIHRQSLENRWTAWVQESFNQSKAQGGTDYEAPANADKLAALDANIKRFAAASSLMHPDKPGVWRDKWALQEGHRATDETFGVTRTAGAPAPAPAPGVRAAPDLSQIPPTLRGAPSAGDTGISGEEFAHLDSMSMGDREKAVAGMTPEQESRYLTR